MPDEGTVRLVARQLGRIPAIYFTVEMNCPNGWPAVLRNSPFDRSGYPNPNIHYLSCPYLRRHIARLEDEGAIDDLQEWLLHDRELMDDLRRAQKEHSREWVEAVAAGKGGGASMAFVAAATASGAGLSGFRIAQARDDALLKCLHAHYAYYLIHDNYRLGMMIAGKLERIWCDDNRCAAIAADISNDCD